MNIFLPCLLQVMDCYPVFSFKCFEKIKIRWGSNDTDFCDGENQKKRRKKRGGYPLLLYPHDKE
jgi:hypothetical protein